MGGTVSDSTGNVHAAPKDTGLAVCERLGREKREERKARRKKRGRSGGRGGWKRKERK